MTRLEEIKERADNAFMVVYVDHQGHTTDVTTDIEWLVERVERVERLEKAMRTAVNYVYALSAEDTSRVLLVALREPAELEEREE